MTLRIPRATYRVQLHGGFRFSDATALVPYLHALGISDLYASPVFQARHGSLHGYDVVDPLRLSSDIGSEEDFRALSKALQDRGMGLLLDIVPNHMAASTDNPWWADVLEHGPSSPYAEVFDIHWDPPMSPAVSDQIVLPILGEPYGRALERQELRVVLDEGGLWLGYHERRFPLEPSTWGLVLEHRLDELRRTAPGEALRGLEALLSAISGLPSREEPPASERRSRREGSRRIRRDLARLLAEQPALRAHVERSVTDLNGTPGDPRSFDRLDDLLRRQAYRLAHFRLASDVVNYRRFFDIGDLVGVRVEDPRVFELTHGLVLRLVGEGHVTGLRVDHIDGLYDPLEYLGRLQAAVGGESGSFYVVVEKILAPGEHLPPGMAAFGTTGYELASVLDGLFVDRKGLDALDAIYVRFSEITSRFEDVLHDQKKRVLEELFGGEIRYHGAALQALAAHDRHGCDLSPRDLERALVEVTACFPVYRSYVRSLEISTEDRAHIEAAFAEARRRDPDASEEAHAFLRRVLLLELPDRAGLDDRRAWLSFVMRFQQLTGPVMAKGLEDTALYQYNRLVSLNAVGGDPDPERSTLSVATFHRRNRARLAEHPHGMNATSTHDSKRSEDVRARLHVLSEIPEAWGRAIGRFRRLNRDLRSEVRGKPVPDPNEEMLIYQALVGGHPNDPAELPRYVERLCQYVVKAAREAKVHTSWQKPDEEHESALVGFVRAALDEERSAEMLAQVRRLLEVVAHHGAINSLVQVLAKIGSPGVPDFYQGSELWSLTLVDPDNRGPVDFALRRRLLAELTEREAENPAGLCEELAANLLDGRIKLHVTRKALDVRRAHPLLFEKGDYVPVEASGALREHVCAFARRWEGDWALFVMPSRVATLGQGGARPAMERVFRATSLDLPHDAPRAWRNALTGESVRAGGSGALPLGELLRLFPVALLVPE